MGAKRFEVLTRDSFGAETNDVSALLIRELLRQFFDRTIGEGTIIVAVREIVEDPRKVNPGERIT